MVKLLQIVLYRVRDSKTSSSDEKDEKESEKEDNEPIRLASASDLSNFNYFTRPAVSDHLRFATRTIAMRSNPGQRATVTLKDIPYVVNIHMRHDGLAVLCVSDKEYPSRVAFSLLVRAAAEFEKSVPKWNKITTDETNEQDYLLKLLAQFQSPEEADKILKIQKTLEEVKDVMNKNIDEILKRGETLDSLVDKSKDLSAVSKQFYKKAKKTNQCCKAW